MKVQVLFYAQLRDLVGMRQLDVDVADGASVRDLLGQLYAHQPKLLQHDKSILIAAGVEFVDRNFKLSPGDEISIMVDQTIHKTGTGEPEQDDSSACASGGQNLQDAPGFPANE